MLLLGKLYLQIFYSISWNLISDNEREGSPDDFVNNSTVGTGSNKYGRRGPEEDFATFGTLLISECEGRNGTREPCALTRHVRAQMRKGNFVPAAKYLYYRFIGLTFFDDPTNTNVFSFNGVRISRPKVIEAAQRALHGDSRPLTQLMLAAGLVLEEEVNAASPARNGEVAPIELSEVQTAIAAATQNGTYVAPRLTEIIEVFGDAYDFALKNHLLDKIAATKPIP